VSFTFSSYQALLVPVLILFAYLGWRRGFWLEVGITIGMGLVVLATVLFPVQFIGFINRILTNIPRVFGVLLGTNVPALDQNLLFGDPDSFRYLLARMALFALLTFLVYSSRFGWAYPAGKPRIATNTAERLLGAGFGAITGLLWFVAVNSFLNRIRALRNQPTLPGEGITLTAPTVPDLTPVLGLIPTIIVVLVIILAVLALLRLPRLWNDPPKK
jgi:hypothetical protein